MINEKNKRLNKVHLPLLEMARTVKVTKEKAEKERAREADDKKISGYEKIKGRELKEKLKE